MNTYFNRGLIAVMAVISLALMAPSGASAATGPWQWSDISNKLTATDNRPVWAIARAEPYWYLTDGQDLWSGGHVWKTDGSVMSDITLEVRNAGISRVDDIVSDGQTVIFLKDVVRTDKNFQALAYNGSYSYPTAIWQNQLSSNEGLASVTGKNGTWMIVTSLGRIFTWNQSANTMTLLTPPGSYILNSPTLDYSTRHTSPMDGQNGFMVSQALPTSNGWIFLVPQSINNYTYNGTTNWRVYQYANGIFNDLTGSFGNLQYINTAASNGSQVLIVGGDQVANYNRAYTVENSYVKTLYNLPAIAWNKALVGYNGKSWMIVSNKDLVRFDGTNFQSYGQTRDYFVQTIGNGNGTFLLGGAVSSDGASGPTSPLTAKLARADEGVSYVDTSSGATNTAYTQETLSTVNGLKNKITYWAWFNPGVKYQANNTQPLYTVGTQSNDGINKIELYINDVYQKTCTPGNTKKNTECSMTINPAAWPLDSNVGAFAKITSAKNQVAYVPASIIRFYDAHTAVTNDGSMSAAMSVDNNTPYLQRGTTSNVYVAGAAGEGINRLEIYVNGQVKQTCSLGGNTTGSCSLTLNGNDYNTNTVVSFNGRVVTQNGRETWTWLGQYTVTDYGYNYSNTNTTLNSSALSATVWFDPSTNDFTTNNTKNIMAQATAPVGLKTIEIFVNGAVKQSCSFGNAYGPQNCQVAVYGSNYSGSFNIPVYVRATDANNQQATSQTLYLNPSNYSYTDNSSDSNNSLSAWLDTSGSSNLGTSETRNVNFYGTSYNGLQELDLYANDALVGSCTFSNPANQTQTCTRSIYGGNYANGQYVTLKVKATDRYGYTAWSTSNTQLYVSNTSGSNNSNGSVTVSTSDSRTSYNSNETITFNGYDSDSDGISRIDLYANGTYVNSCSLGNATYGSCSASILASTYANGSSLPIQAKVTDRYGNVNWSSTNNLTVYDANNDNYSTNVTLSLSPDKTSYARNESFTASAYATDGNGIQKMEIYANGTAVQTCNASYSTTANCSVSLNSANYPSNLYSLPIQAKVTDNNSNVVWSSTRYVTLTDTNGSTSGNDVHGTISLSSNADSGYTAGQQITFTATGSDANGVKRMEIYVGSDLVQSCNASSCSYTGGPYTDYQLIYGAKLIDQLDNTVWSGYKYIYKK